MTIARTNTHETVDEFIEHRFNELAARQLMSRAKSSLQTLTVRLPKGELAAIDKMATFLEMSRQEFLFELIGAGMEQAIRSAANRLHEGPERSQWIEEIVGLWTAHDAELEGLNDE